MQEDFKLIEAFKKGDQQAFEQLVTKYKVPVFKIIYLVIGNIQEADDIAQEVFLKVYSYVGYFKYKASFNTWLYRITYNESIDYVKKKKVKFISLESNLNDDETLQLQNVLQDKSLNIENQMLTKELQNIVKNAINSLPKKYNLVLMLIDLNNLSYQEAAQIMKISVNKLKVWLFRARNKLKKKLEPILNTPHDFSSAPCGFQNQTIGVNKT